MAVGVVADHEADLEGDVVVWKEIEISDLTNKDKDNMEVIDLAEEEDKGEAERAIEILDMTRDNDSDYNM